MSSIAQFAALLKIQPPKVQVLNVLLVGVTLLAIAAIYHSGLRTYTPPDAKNLVTVEAWINGYASPWEYNRSVLRFGVSYIDQEGRQVQSAFLDAGVYEREKLRIGSRLRMTIEVGEQETVLRALVSPEGKVLFDDNFNQQVVAWNNESIWQAVVLCTLAAMGFIFVALLIAWKHRRVLLGRS
ncbi:hypothetical protein ACNFG0_14920 [Pseudomonas sp. NY15372]|uniref:hypothetical protein n=1 Tax=Pseudomonas sp. NY15372 TaxID=3400356 RepID=UPI003A87E2F0